MTELLAHAAIQLEHERCLRLAAHPESDTTDLFGIETLAERQRYYEFRAEALGFALDRFQRYGAALVREYTLREWLQIPGHGRAALVSIPSTEPLPTVGEPVVINGLTYHLIGVETTDATTIAHRGAISVALLVRSGSERKG